MCVCLYGGGKHFMEGRYFSVFHWKVDWVNVECRSHRQCGVHSYVTVCVTQV